MSVETINAEASEQLMRLLVLFLFVVPYYCLFFFYVKRGGRGDIFRPFRGSCLCTPEFNDCMNCNCWLTEGCPVGRRNVAQLMKKARSKNLPVNSKTCDAEVAKR